MTENLLVLVNSIGEWSASNFGNQPFMNPMLGICEELLHELPRVFVGPEDDEVDEKAKDCLADGFIFSCDLIYRMGAVTHAMAYLNDTNWCDRWALGDEEIQESDYDLYELIGKMSQVCLKTSQGIKGYGDNEKSKAEIARLWVSLYFVLDDLSISAHDHTILFLGQEVWDKIVSRRDWVANKETGASNG